MPRSYNINNHNNTQPTLKALSFFTGAGGLDLGMEQEGIEILLACDSEKWMRETIQSNHPKLPIIKNIWDYTADEVMELVNIDHIDVIAGGPPCQSFSTMGARRGIDDARGNVFLHFINLITKIRPQYAVIENVRGVLSMPINKEQAGLYEVDTTINLTDKGGVIRLVSYMLQQAGYTVSFNLYNAANFGVPQIRERVVIIATLNDQAVPYLAPTHSDDPKWGLPAWRTVRDAFNSIPEDTIHHFIPFPEKRLPYYEMLGPGENWRQLPDDVKVAAMGNMLNQKTGGRTGFYRRLAWDKPSPTLVTHPAMPATDLGHPVELRPLSVEEYLAVQQFPSDWKIEGPVLQRYRQLGNAVPVGLGRAVARAVLSHSQGKIVLPPPGFKYSRYSQTSDVDIL